jgi:hypothetical protein
MSNETKRISDSGDNDDDDASQGSDNQSIPTAEEAKLKEDTIAAKETKALLYSRVAMAVLLALTAAAAGATTYFITTFEQENDFEDAVRALALSLVCDWCSRITILTWFLFLSNLVL